MSSGSYVIHPVPLGTYVLFSKKSPSPCVTAVTDELTTIGCGGIGGAATLLATSEPVEKDFRPRLEFYQQGLCQTWPMFQANTRLYDGRIF